MLGLLARIVRLLFALTFVTAIASAIAALVVKDRLRTRGKPDDDEVELVSIFDSLDFTTTARSLRRIEVTAMFGGGTLDLRLATLDPSGATIDARTIFGGFQVVVPPSWRVELAGSGIVGGYGDGRDQSYVDVNGRVLRIEGFSLFGGIGVVPESPEMGAPHLEKLEPRGAPGRAGAGGPGGQEIPAGARGLVTDPEGAGWPTGD